MNEVSVWRVQVGNLYYARAMDTKSYEKKNISSYELTTSADHSWLFPCEEAADRIARELGGERLEFTCTLEEFVYLREVTKAYVERRRISEIFPPLRINRRR